MEGMVCGFCRFREQRAPQRFRDRTTLSIGCPEYVDGQRVSLLAPPCDKFKLRKKGEESRMWQMTQAILRRQRGR